MAKLKNIVKFLDTLLESNDYDDYCPNGLQVEGEDAVDVEEMGQDELARIDIDQETGKVSVKPEEKKEPKKPADKPPDIKDEEKPEEGDKTVKLEEKPPVEEVTRL